ncbi:MAG: VWA domain-containing protein [Rickettsiales bacterium]|nr:VWA domain-containing protein [Rickettsiales bacterium]
MNFENLLNIINFNFPSALLGLFLIPIFIYICHLNLDSPKHKSLNKYFSSNALNFLFKRRNNLFVINLLRALFFCFLIIAIAGPRWDYHEIKKQKHTINNLILLDVSMSMYAIDFEPSRFEQAKKEINAIFKPDNSYGIVAFAKTSYNIIPITSDVEYIKNYLRNLNLNDFENSGSNFNFSLELIDKINKIQNIDNVYIVSDFDFDEEINRDQLKKITDTNIKIIPIKIATNSGAPIKSYQGQFLNYENKTVISKPNNEIIAVINKLQNDLEFKNSEQNNKLFKQRIWEEEYYLFLLPLLIIFLMLNKRSAFLILIFLANYSVNINEALANPFLNQNQNAKIKFNEELFSEASELFTDPYNKGVAAYKNRDYQNAITNFSLDQTPKSRFNLANSYLLNQQLDEAITEYENLLDEYPNDQNAQRNLDIAKMLKQQKQKNKPNNNKDSKDKEKDKNQESKNSEKENQTNAEKNNTKNESTKPVIKKQDNLSAQISNKNKHNIKNQISKSKQDGNIKIIKPW